VGLEQTVNRGVGHEVALLVGESAWPVRVGSAQLQRQLDDQIMDAGRDAVPNPAWRGRPIGQRFRAALKITIILAAEGPARDAQLLQRALCRQVRLLDDPDDLELLGGRIPHASSSPSAIMLFLSRRFSNVRSATPSFRALAPRRRSLTSLVVAARVVSPASRRPGLQKLFRQSGKPTNYALTTLALTTRLCAINVFWLWDQRRHRLNGVRLKAETKNRRL
jgi:hypothetical protein